MADITVIFKDGTKREFKHTGRAGGSYTKTAKYENGWLIIEDEWHRRTVFPQSEIKEVIDRPNHGW